MTKLTKENAKTALIVRNINHPEWGTKKFNYNSEGFHSFGCGCNSALLFENEFKFWEVITTATQKEA